MNLLSWASPPAEGQLRQVRSPTFAQTSSAKKASGSPLGGGTGNGNAAGSGNVAGQTAGSSGAASAKRKRGAQKRNSPMNRRLATRDLPGGPPSLCPARPLCGGHYEGSRRTAAALPHFDFRLS